MEKQIRTRMYTSASVAVCPEDIKRTAYIEGYVFVDENDVLMHTDIQAIFEMIDERGLDVDTETVQEIADEMCPGAAIRDIGSTYIEEGEYAPSTWVFEGAYDDEIYTFGDLEFTDTILTNDGCERKAIYLLDEDNPITYDSSDECVWLNHYYSDKYHKRYIYKLDADTYVLETISLFQGKLDHAVAYSRWGLEQELNSMLEDYTEEEIAELMEDIDSL